MNDRNFKKALAEVLSHEGGYSDHPLDPGGETNYGITKRTATQHGYTGSMRDIPMSKVEYIYHVSYWIESHADEMPYAIALNVFDASVNHGVKNSIKMLQRALKVDDDGIIGVNTIRALKSCNEVNTLLRFNAERLRFYTDIGTFRTFGKGWVRRVADNLKASVYE